MLVLLRSSSGQSLLGQRSLMMSPDKGSPFNSRWEQGVGRLGKSRQNSLRYEANFWANYYWDACGISLSVISAAFSMSRRLIEGGDYSREGCRACRGQPAPLRDGQPRWASTTLASRACNNDKTPRQGKLFQVLTLSTLVFFQASKWFTWLWYWAIIWNEKV